MSNRRMNYKAKWLDAIKAKEENPVTRLEAFKVDAEQLSSFQVNTTLQVDKIRHPLVEGARNAANLLSTMDEFRDCGVISFEETCLPIDAKLGDMDMVTIARRLRDSLRLAEARIGILSVALRDTEERSREYVSELSTVKEMMQRSGEKITELFVIGPGPSEAEKSAADHMILSGEDYRRFGLGYEDHDDDAWDMLRLNKESILRTRRLAQLNELVTDAEDGDDDDDEDEDDDEQTDDDTQNKKHARHDSAIALVHRRNRSASVMPADPLSLH